MTRAGMVNATFKINNVLICELVKPIDSAISPNNGAWLNQTKNVMKNAIHPMCNILFFPEKEKIFSFSDFMIDIPLSCS
jgi:hypothetical protein